MRQRAILIRRIALVAVFLAAHAVDARAQEAPPPPQGLLQEPSIIERAVIFADRRYGNGEFTNGFYPNLWNMIPGAGWISVGPGYRHWYAKDQVFVDASAAVSWRGYKTAQARFELPESPAAGSRWDRRSAWHDFTQVHILRRRP